MMTLTNILREKTFDCIVFFMIAFFSLASQVQAHQTGITFVDYSYEGYASEKADKELEKLSGTGVKWTNILASVMMALL